MIACYDEGALRAHLDDELSAAERAAIAGHLTDCAGCRSRLEELRAQTMEVGTLLAAPEATPSPVLALARLRAAQREQRRPAGVSRQPARGLARLKPALLWRTPMQPSARFWSGPRRPLFAALSAVVIALALLAIPPVRAVAGQLLQVFRVQKVVFVPTSIERIQQLESSGFDGKSLFMAEPTVVNTPAAPRTVGSADEAHSLVGFVPLQPATFPRQPVSTEIVVQDRNVVQFQVNVAGARQLLALMDVNDVTLPDALGTEPIVADVPPVVETHYRGADYELTLIQGPSPSVTLPDGVELAQLGKAALRLLGMEPQQAETLSQNVDWSSTFIFPFPADVGSIRQVTIGDKQGLLVGEESESGSDNHWQLYWQRGDRFLMLDGDGNVNTAELIAVAESIR